jgi:tetratricopeptide (TPR) repeat protein
MENFDPLKQLSTKRRTYSDLSRFISSRTSGVPNYTFLLGSGCSVSSGVRSANQLIEEWRKEVFERIYPEKNYEATESKEILSKSDGVWYNPNREYSSLFEKNFDLPRQRRMFVEKEVSSKNPNLGYAYLIKLIDKGFINTLFTTNFDDLLNEAFFQFSVARPMVCAHDSAISSVTVTSSRPKIIKLHGDYLFDDIKSTVRETESLEENTRKKFIEFGRDFGLVVIGYSGCDRSIMDVLQYLLRSEDHFKHGIYWCIRKGDTPSDELIKLLWRDRVYFVEIDGFDEVMGQLHNDLVGSELPIDTRIVNDKPRTIIRGFCDNPYLKKSSSEVIKRDLDRLEKQNNREALLSTVLDMQKSNSNSEGDELTDGEILITLEIRQLLDSSNFAAARDRIAKEMENSPGHAFRERLSDLKINTEELAGDIHAAISAVDSLILADPNNAENYIRKSHLLHEHEDRVKALELAATISPNNYKIYNSFMRTLVDASNASMGFDRTKIVEGIEINFRRSIDCNPALTNPAWRIYADFIKSSMLSKDDIKLKLDFVVSRCEAMDPRSSSTVRVKLHRLSKYKDDRKGAEADELISRVIQAREKSPKSVQRYFEWLELDCYEKLDRKDELSRKISEIDVNPLLCVQKEYLRRKSKFLMKHSGALDAAIKCLEKSIEQDKQLVDVFEACALYVYKKDGSAIEKMLLDFGSMMNPIEKSSLKRQALIANGSIDAALNQLRATKGKRLLGVGIVNEEVHDLIILKRYDEAETLAKSALESVNWSIHHPELIINYELSRQRKGETITKRRLSDLVEKSDNEDAKGCAHYLLGSFEKSKEIFRTEIMADREKAFIYSGWAIFSDERGARYIESVITTT